MGSGRLWKPGRLRKALKLTNRISPHTTCTVNMQTSSGDYKKGGGTEQIFASLLFTLFGEDPVLCDIAFIVPSSPH